MTETRRTSSEEAKRVGEEIGVDWTRFDLEQFRFGMDVEYEHGSLDPQTDVTHDDPVLTGQARLPEPETPHRREATRRRHVSPRSARRDT